MLAKHYIIDGINLMFNMSKLILPQRGNGCYFLCIYDNLTDIFHRAEYIVPSPEKRVIDQPKVPKLYPSFVRGYISMFRIHICE